MEPYIPREGNGPEFYRVIRSFRDNYGLPIGKSSGNPDLATQMYEL